MSSSRWSCCSQLARGQARIRSRSRSTISLCCWTTSGPVIDCHSNVGVKIPLASRPAEDPGATSADAGLTDRRSPARRLCRSTTQAPARPGVLRNVRGGVSRLTSNFPRRCRNGCGHTHLRVFRVSVVNSTGAGAGRSNAGRTSALMALSPKSFLYTVDPATAVATITLNRPERLNALTFEVYTELQGHLPRARHRARRPRRRSSPAPAGPSAAAATSRTSSARCSRGMPRGCSSSPGSPAISSSPSANAAARSWRRSTARWPAPAP